MFNLFKKSGRQLGIDLGSASIKIAELEKEEGGRTKLVNYAMVQMKDEAGLRFPDMGEEALANILRTIVKEAKFSSKKASISLPVDKTFTTLMDFPEMSEKELVAAIPFEAQKYVPVSLDEVILDWTVVPVPEKAAPAKSEEAGQAGKNTLQVLLIAVHKDVINRLTRIAKLADLEVAALEQEAFSMARSLIGNDKNVYVLADLGKKSTDIIVIDQGFIRLSHNLESNNKEIILMEIDRIVNIYQMKYNRKVGQCVLSGGRVGEKELQSFLAEKLKIPVRVGDPFARVDKNNSLQEILKEIGPQFSVAIGLAMRN